MEKLNKNIQDYKHIIVFEKLNHKKFSVSNLNNLQKTLFQRYATKKKFIGI